MRVAPRLNIIARDESEIAETQLVPPITIALFSQEIKLRLLLSEMPTKPPTLTLGSIEVILKNTNSIILTLITNTHK